MGAYSKNFIDPLSVSSNQASLANISSFCAGIYGEKRFLLEELKLLSAGICIPLGFGGFGISAMYFGHSVFNETELGVAYGKALGKIDIGIQMNLHQINTAGYGKTSVFTSEAGAIAHLTEKLYAGLHVFNPTGSGFGIDRVEKLSTIFSTGVGYEASDKVFISAELIKEQDYPVNINAGLQYVVADKFYVRLGIYTEATNLYFGVGFKWQHFRIDVTASYHSQLGFSPGIFLLYHSKRDSE